MKLSRHQLRKLITEAFFAQPGIKLEPEIRNELGHNEKEMADILYKSEPHLGASLGGIPEDYDPDIPMKNLPAADIETIRFEANRIASKLIKPNLEWVGDVYIVRNTIMNHLLKKFYPWVLQKKQQEDLGHGIMPEEAYNIWNEVYTIMSIAMGNAHYKEYTGVHFQDGW